MRFGLLTTLLGLAMVPALSPAAPVPRDTGLRYFYPTRVGDRMVRTETPGDRDIVTTVAKVEKTDGGLRVTMNWVAPDGKESLDETMEVSSKGVRMLNDAYRGRPLPHPIWKIKSTPDADAVWSNRWPVTYQGGIVFQEQDLEAKGWETVEVPAGKFLTVRVERNATLLGDKTHCTLWYAPDVGCVKWKSDTSGSVLKSFTRGPN